MPRLALHAAVFGLPGVVLFVLGFAYWAHLQFVRPGPLTAARTVVIQKGAGVERIARKLLAGGVIGDRFLFGAGVRVTGRSRVMRPGEYRFPAGVSMDETIALLARGETVKRKITVAEGLTTTAVLGLIGADEGLTGALPADVEEGSLLPETYYFSLGDTRATFVRRMRESMTETLLSLWDRRAPGLALAGPEEALVLASIIERETALASERALVSAVFHNRLRRGMRLQSDPTVVYALTGGKAPLDRPLSKTDLRIESPYNTYRVNGLPPAPIANPGRASIEAALHPAESDALYFVADGKGGHAFARSFTEHLGNVARWRRIERERRQGQQTP